ncbi:MAG: DoxX family membrane protein [Pyrinomonadaceae bacterium]|nr:DoxX family membrane protein [Pyrinomonadaceae bacterium]
MAPLIVLLVSFGTFFALNRFLLGGRFSLSLAGRASLAVMLFVTGVTHFTNTDVMAQMIPEFMPAKRELVYFTGFCELLAVIGLLWNRTARLTAYMLLLFFIMVLPANIAGSLKQVELGGMANGASYLLFRIPLQILFIAWIYYFGIYLTRPYQEPTASSE